MDQVMRTFFNLSLSITLIVSLFGLKVYANPQLANFPGARANMTILDAQEFTSTSFSYSHELMVALPASYDVQKDSTFPVLWVLDSPMMFRTVVGLLDILVIGNQAPEMIVIGVGSAPELGLPGIGRRIMEFSPNGEGYQPSGLPGQRFFALAPIPPFPHRANDFLGLLVDEIRPNLAEKYRFTNEHTLFGHSAGGMFASYTLFQRPNSFDNFIIGSPYLDGVQGAVFKAEAVYAEKNKDLDARIFLGVGEREPDEYFVAMSGILDASTRFNRILKARHYPSLDMKTRIFAGKNHYTVVPEVLIEGISYLWREEIEALPSSWPNKP